jgi:hypothetical protein
MLVSIAHILSSTNILKNKLKYLVCPFRVSLEHAWQESTPHLHHRPPQHCPMKKTQHNHVVQVEHQDKARENNFEFCCSSSEVKVRAIPHVFSSHQGNFCFLRRRIVRNRFHQGPSLDDVKVDKVVSIASGGPRSSPRDTSRPEQSPRASWRPRSLLMATCMPKTSPREPL